VTKEQDTIAQFKDLEQRGLITKYELDWCVGAIRNRHELSRTTRHQLRDTVQEILKRARTRSGIDKEQI
jgi:hypothetical protein